jgi:hypothetical protein
MAMMVLVLPLKGFEQVKASLTKETFFAPKKLAQLAVCPPWAMLQE